MPAPAGGGAWDADIAPEPDEIPQLRADPQVPSSPH